MNLFFPEQGWVADSGLGIGTIGFCITNTEKRRRPLATKLCGTSDVFKAGKMNIIKEEGIRVAGFTDACEHILVLFRILI